MADKPFEKFIDDVISDKKESNRVFCDGCSSEDLAKTLASYDPLEGALSCGRSCECCGKFKWACDRAFQNAQKIGLEWRDILSKWEERRRYWYMNYYQDAHQPAIGDEHVYVFEDLEALRKAVGSEGFICPSCGGISKSPYECTLDDCDWKSYGFFGCMGKGAYVFVKSELYGEGMFMPVAFSKIDKGEGSDD